MHIEIEDLPNIGKVIAKELREIGIDSHLKLCELGSVETLLRLKSHSGRSCINTLYALEGAIQKIRWHDIPKVEKDRLLQEYKEAHI